MEHPEKSWLALLEASAWEFPLAVQKWMLGVEGGNQDVEEVALKAYHGWVSLANIGVDRFCQAKGFCDLMTGSLNWLLQWQRLGRSIADTWRLVRWWGCEEGPGPKTERVMKW